jgi:type VI secretion system secreted protein VgrG
VSSATEYRLLDVQTPLGDEKLILASFLGREEMSRLFRYDLEMVSMDQALAPKAIVGQKVTWSVTRFDKTTVYWNGLVSRFVAGEVISTGHRLYRAEVVPWLWFLTLQSDCRIFQGKTVPQIIAKIFDDLGFTAYEIQCSGHHATWDYCVQYRETSFNFVSRLMELEGIFYYFRHENDKHTLVISDQKSAYKDCLEKEVAYRRNVDVFSGITAWEHRYTFRTGKWALTDYNFESPGSSTSQDLMTKQRTTIDLNGPTKFEKYDYPGGYIGKPDAMTEIRIEEEEVEVDVVQGGSNCTTFRVGGKFKVKEHICPSEAGKSYAITSIEHKAVDRIVLGTGSEQDYENRFTCVPDSVVFRPARISPKPFVQGPQTAVVTGPGGEEIYVDKYGRVKVQFYWDREGKKNEDSSCWLRVSELWAGKNWGIVFHPRIGQEVIVDFLEGDPDRPIVTGRVYNAQQMPPYDLPGNKTEAGIKTRSSKGGSPANYNEVRFEDKKGSELLTIHAEKDQTIEVEHDESHWVGHDRKKTIDHDETTHVKHDRTETVDHNETITIHGARTETVDKNETITIHGARTETVDKDESITIGGGRTENVGKDESISIGGSRTETVGKDESITIGNNRTESVGKDESITIGGGRTESVGKDESITIGGGRTESVAKDESVTVGGSRAVSITKSDSLNVGKALSVMAADSISFTTGDASITLKKDGTITISGKDITITGSGEIVGKASKNMTLKGQKILQN